MSPARHLLREWPRIRRRIPRADRVALFTDFDGTLIRIQRHPGGGKASRQVRALLAEMAGAGAVVGVISGRQLEDVRRRVDVPGLWYAGVHGFDLRDPQGRVTSRLTRAGKSRVARAARRLQRGVGKLPGVSIEPKGGTVAVHYRRASWDAAAEASQAVRDLAGQLRLHLSSGKKIWELCADPRIDKWSAVQFILGRERRRNRRAGQMTIFLGDDTTDERVFEKLRGLSVAVGKRHKTAARYYLRSPKEVRLFLLRLRKELA